jgi:thiamine kinase-like enzyme
MHMGFALKPGPIHGDAHTRNLLTDHGTVVLIDFEAAAYGPREWDLLPTAIAVERYGLAEERYKEFATAYGFDVRAWPGFPVLREIRELTMTTWIMQNVKESPGVHRRDPADQPEHPLRLRPAGPPGRCSWP